MINRIINKNTGKEVQLNDGTGFYDYNLGRYLREDEVLILDKDDDITREVARLIEPRNQDRIAYEIETVSKKVLNNQRLAEAAKTSETI